MSSSGALARRDDDVVLATRRPAAAGSSDQPTTSTSRGGPEGTPRETLCDDDARPKRKQPCFPRRIPDDLFLFAPRNLQDCLRVVRVLYSPKDIRTFQNLGNLRISLIPPYRTPFRTFSLKL
ncbi:hypothetical protein L596_015219 [Steinernema carpocapsae]|uniref:Uncharacterized protein n=1 Tax=Steinernema carpocapsae TaxID=34508 RepID=A0A4U5NF85_STECR|nr:hypothetical protein L596_015219 [Steinernema carpocapsae]